MQFAVDIPNFGPYAEPHVVVEVARAAEEAGWDGLSLWDHILYFSGNPVGDPWVLLSAAAVATERIRLMMMVTPLPRRRPWVVARQSVSLDQLSNGRFVLGVGIGYPPEPEFGAFGEPTDERRRADMLDESLAILDGMWSGEPFSFAGEHYTIEENDFLPVPVQRPRIPIWVAGMWPIKRPFRRAARWDGCAPIAIEDGEIRLAMPEDVAAIQAYMDDVRPRPAGYDMAVTFAPPADRAATADLVAQHEDAGTTWLRVLPAPDQDAGDFTAWIAQGPPA